LNHKRMHNVQVGVIGCGYWGPKLIRNFYELPGSNLAMVCDLRPERLEHIQNLYGVPVTQSIPAVAGIGGRGCGYCHAGVDPL